MSLPREKNARFSFVLDLVNDGSFFLCVVGISTRDMGGSVFFWYACTSAFQSRLLRILIRFRILPSCWVVF